MPDTSDPRIFFAAERTLLAWLRTGIAVIGLGFLVARFGLFLEMIRQPERDVVPHLGTAMIGVSLVFLGAFMVGGATWQHLRFFHHLGASERPDRYNPYFAILASACVAVVGLMLAVYLVWV